MKELTFWEWAAVAIQTAIATLPLVIAFEHERIAAAIKRRMRRKGGDEE